jgi:hypothetical protein
VSDYPLHRKLLFWCLLKGGSFCSREVQGEEVFKRSVLCHIVVHQGVKKKRVMA